MSRYVDEMYSECQYVCDYLDDTEGGIGYLDEAVFLCEEFEYGENGRFYGKGLSGEWGELMNFVFSRGKDLLKALESARGNAEEIVVLCKDYIEDKLGELEDELGELDVEESKRGRRIKSKFKSKSKSKSKSRFESSSFVESEEDEEGKEACEHYLHLLKRIGAIVKQARILIFDEAKLCLLKMGDLTMQELLEGRSGKVRRILQEIKKYVEEGKKYMEFLKSDFDDIHRIMSGLKDKLDRAIS